MNPRAIAQAYRERGWSPIPLKVRSKEPKLPKGHPFLSRPATDEEFESFRFGNVGLVTGKVSGILVLDDDDGGETLRKNRWHVPPTVTVTTARGHQHYFRCPPKGFPTCDLAPKVEVRGDGAYVVAPPSVHPSGHRYSWAISPDDEELADPPRWLLEQGRSRQHRRSADPVGETILDGSRNKSLFSLGGSLRRRGLDEAGIAAALLGVNATKCRPPLGEDEVRKIAASVSRYEPEDPLPTPSEPKPQSGPPPSFNFTDLGNAERLVYRHGADLRYCYSWGKWLAWDGIRWRVGTVEEVERRAKATIRDIYSEAANEPDDARRKALVDHGRRSEARPRIEAMIALARSESGIPVEPEALDADPWLLNCPNATIDLRDGTARRHERRDLITKVAGTDYDPQAEAPRFERFLREVLVTEDVIGFMRRFAGYSLTGSTRERVMAILHGRGKNGKSTLVELLQDVMADYGTSTDTETVLAKRYQGVGNDVAALKGARLVATAEVEWGRRLAEAKIKTLTGTDTVSARFLYGEPFTFRPQFKLWLSTNNKPVIRGQDDGIWDRIRLIPFNQRFVGNAADPKLSEKLREELPGVLAWLVRGAIEWQHNGLDEPDVVRAATEGYREEMDVLAQFLEERCVIRDGVWVRFSSLWTAYQDWCSEAGENPETKSGFGSRLKERGFEPARGTGNVPIRRGIALRDDHHPDPEEGRRVTRVTESNATVTDEIPPTYGEFEQTSYPSYSSYRKNNDSVANPFRVDNYQKNGNSGNSGNSEPSEARLTDDEAEEVKRLMSQGMKASFAREDVLKKRHTLEGSA